VTLDVVTTRHGPIITELLPGETRKIALRWTLQDGMGLMFFDVNSAQNWNDFARPSQPLARRTNVMYADVDGTSAIRPPDECPSEPPATAACRSAAATTRTSG